MPILSWSAIQLVTICFGICLIILLTIGGNLVVLFAFYNDPHLLTPSNNFLLSMAIADLLVGLIAMPFYSYAQIKSFWPFGKLFCKIWLTIDDVATMASVLSIVAITIERYWSINHSVHYRRYTTKTRIRIFSLLIWFIPLINFAPGIWLLQSHADIAITNATKKNHSACIGAYHSHTIYLIVAQINFFAWPLVVIIILNALIVVNLYRRSQRFPSYNSFCEQRINNTLRKSKENIDEHHPQTNVNDDQTISIINESNYHILKKMNSEGSNENHHGNIPSPIREVDELMVEHDTIESLPSPQILPSSPVEIDAKQLSSSSNIYTRFKHVFLPPSISMESSLNAHHSSKSTQTFHLPLQPTRQKRRSLFAWRNSTHYLSRKNTKLASVTGEQRNVRRLRRDKRAATSLLIFVLVFMIFLLPYVFVVVVGNIFSLESLIDIDGQVYSAAFWLLWLNSSVNPILYPFIQPKFREAYRKIFLRLTRRRRRLVSLIVDIQRDK
ncbi:unnamed protein product [Rotaria magnacalcarata]|uniref:G-protein coupled receptors family 1 profile domain-containing protein n=1 Tax=Rotaria magnacalcarata TaxID=392030 RepID=A0A816YT82_9BILA|nr:unnamed protein product [Rotaria magnacalcarata]CAF1685237.1 unnamed protein product [Rotaria magnacalcarata]CAF2014349.1 unnamed protein product [Rotaria magnacalcarata]CAF2163091.1 unnamed protein product [Rotaria magnacalcarata]CAF2167455.1 unnamed protein product [Rotaria magnacalcarata]